jgi:hypothetical protein
MPEAIPLPPETRPADSDHAPFNAWEHLPSPPTDVVVWVAEDHATAARGIDADGARQVRTEVLTDRWSTSCRALSVEQLPDTVPAFWLVGVTPATNILACLQRARDRLMAAGRVVITFGDEDRPSRLPRWREFWASIGQRLGFEVRDRGSDHLVLELANEQPRWRLALATERDWPQVGELFEAIYHQPLDRELWAWKYAEGRGNAVLAFKGDQLVAHYGGMYRDILLRGQPEWAMQVGDVMVHPAQRAVWTRQGAFFLTCSTWAEMYGPFDFGFPSGRHMRLAEKLGIYVQAGKVLESRWTPAESTRPRAGTRLQPVDAQGGAIGAEIDVLWSAMAADLAEAAVCVRDWQWLQRRYLHHPSFRYEVVSVRARWTGRLIGVLVIRLHPDECELLDLIGRLADIPLLIDQARRICALRRRGSLYLWISDTRARHFQVHGAAQREIDLEIPTDGWTGSSRAGELVHRWWLTAGDSDYR